MTSRADFESKLALNGNVKLHYIAAGAGPPLVFLHGFPDHGLGWRRQIEVLSANFRVLAPDLRHLVELLAAGELEPQIGLRTSWNDVSEAAEALLDRRVAGKAVLDVA